MTFDPRNDPIAITIPEFTVKRTSDPGTYCEPYIVSFAVDDAGETRPHLAFNLMPFPKVARGGVVKMLGDGHLLYGPKQPGAFVALSILFMESDSDVRSIGHKITTFVQGMAMDLGLKAVIGVHPTAGAVLGILKELTTHVAGLLRENGDDYLFRSDGTFLREHPCPYHVNRRYEYENDYIRYALQIVPLTQPNCEGRQIQVILL